MLKPSDQTQARVWQKVQQTLWGRQTQERVRQTAQWMLWGRQTVQRMPWVRKVQVLIQVQVQAK